MLTVGLKAARPRAYSHPTPRAALAGRLGSIAVVLGTLAALSVGAPARATVVMNVNLYLAPDAGGGRNYENPVPTGVTAAALDPSGAPQWNNIVALAGAYSPRPDFMLVDSFGTLPQYHGYLVDSFGNATTTDFWLNYRPTAWHCVDQPGMLPYLYEYPTMYPGANADFDGLDTSGNTRYDLYVYNWWDQEAPNTVASATIAVTRCTGAAPAPQTNTYTLADAGTDRATLTEGVNYVRFTGLVPDASGILEVTNTDLTNSTAFNAFQLVAIPAVSSPVPAPQAAWPVLVAMGGLMLMRRRRLACTRR